MNKPDEAATALIAEDEPLLAQALVRELSLTWPGLRVLATVGDGLSAVTQALRLQPDVLFFDIRMPGQSGLEAAAELADAWPGAGPQSRPFPALVFVTAYDQYALQAFDAQAIDYLVKPVQAARLLKTVAKVRDALAHRRRGGGDDDFEAILGQLRQLLDRWPTPDAVEPSRDIGSDRPLRVIQAGMGSGIRMVPVADVICFEAADKYIRVLTSIQDYLIRTPLKDLLPQLDAAEFWQVHRGTVVRAAAIDSVCRDGSGRLNLRLRGRPERLPVSRLYAHRFKVM